MRKNRIPTVLILLALLTLAACAPLPPAETVDPNSKYGFLWGIVHGAILPFVVLCKLFGVKAGIYAISNTGFWYWVGYFLGIGALGGGASRARRR